MNGQPRLIFVSDMGDSLSRSVPFEFLEEEIIKNVSSLKGSRHIWLWLTKQPMRMAQFSQWLTDRGIAWPDNLVAMTSVTSEKTVVRVEHLRKVRCKFHGLSVEPLWSPVELPLDGIDWVIVGGESGAGAKPFELKWARDIIRQCRRADVAPFVKQLGACPRDGGHEIDLRDSHGGDWDEWPEELRVREFPDFSQVMNPPCSNQSHF
jgi:protein gp37